MAGDEHFRTIQNKIKAKDNPMTDKQRAELEAAIEKWDTLTNLHALPTLNLLAEAARSTLTRPPLDLAGLKMEITKAALAGEVFIINLQDIDATLDHLQAIRPDLFGGK